MSEGKPTYKIRKARNGEFYFVVVATNGEILSTSETYKRQQGAIDGAIASGGEEILSDGPLEYELPNEDGGYD